jgi:hypothetical protein
LSSTNDSSSFEAWRWSVWKKEKYREASSLKVNVNLCFRLLLLCTLRPTSLVVFCINLNVCFKLYVNLKYTKMHYLWIELGFSQSLSCLQEHVPHSVLFRHFWLSGSQHLAESFSNVSRVDRFHRLRIVDHPIRAISQHILPQRNGVACVAPA